VKFGTEVPICNEMSTISYVVMLPDLQVQKSMEKESRVYEFSTEVW